MLYGKMKTGDLSGLDDRDLKVLGKLGYRVRDYARTRHQNLPEKKASLTEKVAVFGMGAIANGISAAFPKITAGIGAASTKVLGPKLTAGIAKAAPKAMTGAFVASTGATALSHGSSVAPFKPLSISAPMQPMQPMNLPNPMKLAAQIEDMQKDASFVTRTFGKIATALKGWLGKPAVTSASSAVTRGNKIITSTGQAINKSRFGIKDEVKNVVKKIKPTKAQKYNVIPPVSETLPRANVGMVDDLPGVPNNNKLLETGGITSPTEHAIPGAGNSLRNRVKTFRPKLRSREEFMPGHYAPRVKMKTLGSADARLTPAGRAPSASPVDMVRQYAPPAPSVNAFGGTSNISVADTPIPQVYKNKVRRMATNTGPAAEIPAAGNNVEEALARIESYHAANAPKPRKPVPIPPANAADTPTKPTLTEKVQDIGSTPPPQGTAETAKPKGRWGTRFKWGLGGLTVGGLTGGILSQGKDKPPNQQYYG